MTTYISCITPTTSHSTLVAMDTNAEASLLTFPQVRAFPSDGKKGGKVDLFLKRNNANVRDVRDNPLPGKRSKACAVEYDPEVIKFGFIWSLLLAAA